MTKYIIGFALFFIGFMFWSNWQINAMNKQYENCKPLLDISNKIQCQQ